METIKSKIEIIVHELSVDGTVDSINTVKAIVKIENNFQIEIPDEKTIELIGLSKMEFCEKVSNIVCNILHTDN